jgi:hypothetical protein
LAGCVVPLFPDLPAQSKPAQVNNTSRPKTDSLFEWRAAGIVLISHAAATPTLRHTSQPLRLPV